MEASINELVENIAYALGDQYNFTLRESLKQSIVFYRHKLLREDDFQNSLNLNDFNQKIILELEDYENALGCEYRITKEKLPKSIRFKSRGRVNYNYIGNILGNKEFTMTTLVEYDFLKKLQHQTETIYYVIEDEKILILNNDKLCDIRVELIAANPLELQNSCLNVEEVDDDSPFPISGDLMAIIRKGIISGDFPIRQIGEQGVIETDTNEIPQQ